MIEREYVCKFCNKKFPSGKSLGGHIRIHTNEYSVHSNSNSGKHLKKKKNKKRLADQRESTALKQPQQEQLCCRECGKGFYSLKALCNHMDCHCEEEKLLMDSHSDSETTSSGPTRKRSKKVMKQSSSGSFSSSSASEIDQEHKNTALSLMMMSIDSKGHNLVVNSLAESSENNSEILETKTSSGEQLKMIFNVKNQDSKTDEVGLLPSCDSYSSDSDYFMNGPKKSHSDICVDGSLRNTGFRNADELGVMEGGPKYELRKGKKVFLPSSETDSCADTNSKIHRSSDSNSPMVKKASSANKSSKGHECPICLKVFKSGQAKTQSSS